MKIMKDIICHMKDTMDEAEDYVSEARLLKEEHPNLFNTYIKLAEEHLQHYMSLHSAVVMIINDFKRLKGEPPAVMKAIWDYEHERLVEEYEDIRKAIERAKMM
jgi:predicted metal-dependent HD superfamily phosphohydrolase